VSAHTEAPPTAAALSLPDNGANLTEWEECVMFCCDMLRHDRHAGRIICSLAQAALSGATQCVTCFDMAGMSALRADEIRAKFALSEKGLELMAAHLEFKFCRQQSSAVSKNVSSNCGL